MAYTIIGQNNSVTTIDDGNGHTLHVPSRVALAIGTTFTIVEVNNNMATLEDSNGKVYRDIPCVVDLVCSGGGGSSLPDQTGHSGEFLTTDGTDASWAAVDTLPSQTGNSGKFLTTDGTDASWGLTVGGTFTNYYSGDAIKLNAHSGHSSDRDIKFRVTTDSLLIGFGNNFVYRNEFCFSWQNNAFFPINWATGTSKTLGTSSYKWGNIYVEKINNGANITVPAVAGEMAVKQVNTTITLASADWSSNTQTVNVTGMTATGVVMVSPDPTDQSAYTSAGILCTAQAAGTLTFTCDTVPSGDIDVNVVML